MLHFSCDLCGKSLHNGAEHYVVKMELFVQVDSPTLTDSDLDDDHLEAISQMLSDLEDDQLEAPPPATRQFRYDLCTACQKKFARDPLNRESASKFLFSEN